MAIEFGGYDERDEAPKSKLRAPYKPYEAPQDPEDKERIDPYPVSVPSSLA